jgi:hypothetical protein
MAAHDAGNTTASILVYTTLATYMVLQIETAPPSNTTATILNGAAGATAVSPDDIPYGWLPDEHRADTARFHAELIYTLGILVVGIAAIWLWSLCG